ncbi:hypothetical protein FISHEDRAFT_39674 [Fistulina hepatica ATCC 64428]|uniref:GPI mannosyltransferase 2 n=1 Tax=Fistulina hepatica ATCC 64428 TaxID=1128425 RepID=A0A0D7AG86_9AGAR|nr:hypothetical protein FISHEDRAFT_39674 [Fistulina hepatica ATCC 64428]
MQLASQRHITRLNVLSTSVRALLVLYVLTASRFTSLFDASPEVVQSMNATLSKPLLRWDVFHFDSIAQHGYQYEHHWAFFPGVTYISRFVSQQLSSYITDVGTLTAGCLAALMFDGTITLYELSLLHTRSRHLSFLSALLSLIPSSPVTLRLAPYAEPFFTYMSYRGDENCSGMLYCAQERYFLGAWCFMLASFFRSNGIMLAGFIVWGLVAGPLLLRRKVHSQLLSAFILAVYCTLLVSLCLAPFMYHQYTAYRAFCNPPSNLPIPPPVWCHRSPPLIYSYVQHKYWNTGLFQYWTLQQLPNFLIASPPLMLIFSYAYHYFKHGPLKKVFLRGSQSGLESHPNPLLCVPIVPHAIHAVIFCSTLLFVSHTQISLRLVASMPFTYWAAAWLMIEHPSWGKWWVCWSVLWAITSVILWVAFLPPA